MVQYLDSSNVKMFPSAFRDSSKDQESYFTTEGNLTKSNVLGYANKSFVEVHENSDNISIVISGYRFDVAISDITSISAFSSSTDIYANIKVVAKGSTGGFSTLVSFEDGTSTILDNSSTEKFVGIAFNDNNIDEGWSNSLKVLEKVSDIWKVPSASKLIINANQVISGSGQDATKSIAEKLTSGEIIANTSITSNGTLTSSGKITGNNGLQITSGLTTLQDVWAGETQVADLNIRTLETQDGPVLTQPTSPLGKIGKADNSSTYTRTSDSGNNVKVISKITQTQSGKISVEEVNLPVASSTQAGLVTTQNQTFVGDKTFTNIVVTNLNSRAITDIFEGNDSSIVKNATNANKLKINQTTTNQMYNVALTTGSVNYKDLGYTSNVQINPSSGRITCGDVVSSGNIQALSGIIQGSELKGDVITTQEIDSPVYKGNYIPCDSDDVVNDVLKVYLTGFTLKQGCHIFLQCGDHITASKLNVQNSGDKLLGYYVNGTFKEYPFFDTGRVCEVLYNGSRWIVLNSSKVEEVTTRINGHALSEIFESDGVTAKKSAISTVSNKLSLNNVDYNVGNSHAPTYFENGIPTSCRFQFDYYIPTTNLPYLADCISTTPLSGAPTDSDKVYTSRDDLVISNLSIIFFGGSTSDSGRFMMDFTINTIGNYRFAMGQKWIKVDLSNYVSTQGIGVSSIFFTQGLIRTSFYDNDEYIFDNALFTLSTETNYFYIMFVGGTADLKYQQINCHLSGTWSR